MLFFFCGKPVDALVEDIAKGIEGRGFDSWAGQIEHCVSNASLLLRPYSVAQTLCSVDGTRHSLHASA